MLFAYADPPYIGQSKRHYGKHPDYAGEVDHVELIQRLCANYPDGWALSLSAPTLQQILAMCPPDVRVGAWVKPFASFKPGVNPGFCWEPVIFRGGRKKRDRSEPTVRDFVSCNITMRRGLSGVKPRAVCLWIFDMLGAQHGDTMHDLFPGSGAVQRAWNQKFTGEHSAVGTPLFGSEP